MKLALLFLFVGAVVLTFILSRWVVAYDWKAVDIRFNSTYLVINLFHFVVAVLLIALALFSLGGVLGTGFKSRPFLILFLATWVINGLVAWGVYKQFHSS